MALVRSKLWGPALARLSRTAPRRHGAAACSSTAQESGAGKFVEKALTPEELVGTQHSGPSEGVGVGPREGPGARDPKFTSVPDDKRSDENVENKETTSQKAADAVDRVAAEGKLSLEKDS